MTTEIPLSAYLTLGAFMFMMGMIGVVTKRNPIVVFMCIELMLNAVNLTFLSFAKFHPTFQQQIAGHMYVVFVIAVAAAEVAVGLGIIMAIFRLRESVDVDEINLMHE